MINGKVQRLLALSPNVERLLSPFIFHKSWHQLDASNDGEVDRSEFVSFAMKAESGLNEEEEDQNHRQEVTATPASPMDLDLALLKIYRDLRRCSDGIDPTPYQVSLYLSNLAHRRSVARTHMRHHKNVFLQMTSFTFLQFSAGQDPDEENEQDGEKQEDGEKQDEQQQQQQQQQNQNSCSLKDFLKYCWYIAETTTTNSNSLFELLELRALRTVFSQLDRNGDGSLTKREVKRAIVSDADVLKKTLKAFPEMSQAFRPRNVRSLIRLFDVADATGDGVLEFEEFVIMQRQLKAISATHRLFDIAAGVAGSKQKNNDTCRRKDLYTCMALHRGGFDNPKEP